MMVQNLATILQYRYQVSEYRINRATDGAKQCDASARFIVWTT